MQKMMDDEHEEPAYKETTKLISYSKSHCVESPSVVRGSVDFENDINDINDTNEVNHDTKFYRFMHKKKKEKPSIKPRLENILEQSFQTFVYHQDLQKNIEQIDCEGNVVKRSEDYNEENKLNVEVDFNRNDEKNNEEDKRTKRNRTKLIDSLKRKELVDDRETKKNKILQNLNSSTINRSNVNLNRSSFDLSIIERDKSFFANKSFSFKLANKLNRSLISQDLDNLNDFSSNLNQLYISFDETKNLTLSDLDELSDLDKILKFCKPKRLIQFENILDTSRQIDKMAEGSYGEVYRYDATTILKVIKLEEDQLDQILPELIVSFTLNEMQKKFNFDNFIKLKSSCLVKDKYSEQLLNAWYAYNEKVGSENDDPSNFDDESLFILLFLEDGGLDLESFKGELNAKIAISIFQQVLTALACAEQQSNFEHRDLHLSNILIKSTDQKEIRYILNEKCYKIQTNGIKIKIIDYSLSRFSRNGITLFQDLNECISFDGKGDIQYDCYRKMKKLTENNWSSFCPSTNLVWIDYLLTKLDSFLVSNCKNKRRDYEEKQLLIKLRKWKMELKKYNSCLEALELFDLLD